MAHIPSRFVPPFEFELGSDDSTVPLSNGHRTTVKGILQVEVHHARDIHNICIHEKQDVYAKISILQDGVEATTYCTDVVSKGGKDPVFNHKFETSSLVASDSVLRCEVWMSSKLKGYLEDQQLGTVSVPISGLVGKKKQFTEYQLSTTELFYSPAGSISMTLGFELEAASSDVPENMRRDIPTPCDSGSCTSACSDGDTFSVLHSTSAIQFTDLDAAREDEELVSDFIRKRGKRQSMASKDGILTGPPYLTGESIEDEQDKSQLGHVEDKKQDEKLEGVKNVACEAETGEVNDEVNNEINDKQQETNNGLKKKLQVAVSTSSSFLESSSVVTNSMTPSSSSRPKEDAGLAFINNSDVELGKLAVPEMVPEPRILQEEIMDMYMKSMQQFSEALAKMQLPVVDDNGMIKSESDPNATKDDPQNDDTANTNTSNDSGKTSSGGGKTNNNGSSSKVFYGSRAFF